jgi:hypothetical protein
MYRQEEGGVAGGQEAFNSVEMVLGRFTQLYHIQFGGYPLGPIEGLARAILVGELKPVTQHPVTWPLDRVLPLLRRAWIEVAIEERRFPPRRP